MDYYTKYIKYKNKYLQLKEIIGGEDKSINTIQNREQEIEQKLKGKIEKKDLIHIWLKTWPDQGVPNIKVLYDLILFIYDDIKKRKNNTVIHCAGGIGRTGSVYMILKLMNEHDNGKLKLEDLESRIIELLNITRRHRPQAVEQVIQVEYIYRIIRRYIDKTFKYEDELNKEIKDNLDPAYCNIPEYQTEHIDKPHKKDNCTNEIYNTAYNINYKKVNYSCGYDKLVSNKKINNEKFCLDPVDASGNVKKCKNRYNENPASKEYRINLNNTKINNDKPILSDKKEDYINADLMMPLKFGNTKVYIIATQAPIQTSIDDFKSMIKKYNVKRIIMLTRIYEENKDGKDVIIEEKGKDGNTDKKNIKIKEKADDYINLDAKFENGYANTYFNINNEDNVKPEIAKVLFNDNDIKISKLAEDWFNIKNNKKC